MKKLTPEEQDAWQRANVETKVWKRGKTLPAPRPERPVFKNEIQRQERWWERAHFEQQNKGAHFGVDRILPKKTKSIVIEAFLDLHGDTRAQAKENLFQFLYKNQLLGRRWVRVITGKSGVLCQEVPSWLEEYSSLVSGYTQAPQQDGGRGALYVRIRWSSS